MERGEDISQTKYASDLVLTSLANGANGFMFSASETTLSILRNVTKSLRAQPIVLYAIVPYAYEYVRIATQTGMVGLGKKLATQVVLSGNLRVIAAGVKAVAGMDPESLMKAYLYYEISRIQSSMGKLQNLDSILFHEVVTDMIVALNLERLVRSYVRFLSGLGIKPGFETRNFAYLVNKFREWHIDFNEISIVAPFNKVGFQMNPSKEECEEALVEIPECTVIAMSTLAAGYLKLPEAIDYVKRLPNIDGVVIGVSKEKHAIESFMLAREKLETTRDKA